MSNIINKDLYFHECELKYRLFERDKEIYIDQLNQLGFEMKEDILETDYTPDVDGFLCRKNNVMLRFRIIEGTRNDCLVTLKVKGENESFNDNYELEYYDSNFSEEVFAEINKVLLQYTGCCISKELSNERKVGVLITELKKIGFINNRMLSQKKRTIYTKDDIKISFDRFPRDIGEYMEVETSSPSKLQEFVEAMKYDVTKIEKLNYGLLIQKKQAELSDDERRVCVFDIEEK